MAYMFKPLKCDELLNSCEYWKEVMGSKWLLNLKGHFKEAACLSG